MTDRTDGKFIFFHTFIANIRNIAFFIRFMIKFIRCIFGIEFAFTLASDDSDASGWQIVNKKTKICVSERGMCETCC